MSQSQTAPVKAVRLKTHAIVGGVTRAAGWEGEVDQDVAETMIDDVVAELANAPAAAPIAPHLAA